MREKGVPIGEWMNGRRHRRRTPRGSPATRALVLAAALAAALTAACDDPTVPLEPPAGLDRAMALLLVLDPGYTVQPLWIEGADVLGDVGLDERIEDVSATVGIDGRTILRAGLDTTSVFSPCGRYRLHSANTETACVALGFRPDPGETYTITVTAPGRPTATATTRVPGHFHILEYDAEGSPPGTDGLSARWSPSIGAHRYFVGFRPDSIDCAPAANIHVGCFGEWYTSTARPEIDTEISEAAYERAVRPWTLDVYALDRALYEYLTSGSGGAFFAVPPVSNVEGGYGVVGAWVRRSRPLEP